MIERLNIDFQHHDERGDIYQIASFTNNQINFLYTKKGAKRGCHYHKLNREYFYLVDGRITVTLWNVNDNSTKDVFEFKKGDFFCVLPFTFHDFKFVDDTRMIVIYDVGVECDGSKDIYTE